MLVISSTYCHTLHLLMYFTDVHPGDLLLSIDDDNMLQKA